MGYVLKNQGYDTIEDYRALGGATLTSWGTEDRVLFRPSDPPILWNPRLFSRGQRLNTIGGHVDLNATIADLLGSVDGEKGTP